MKFKVGDKVKTPRDGEGTITRAGQAVGSRYYTAYEEYEVRIDEPNIYTTVWHDPCILYFQESELQKVEHDQNAR